MFKATFRNPRNPVDAEVLYFKTASEAVAHEIVSKELTELKKVKTVPDCFYVYEEARQCL